MFRYQNSWTKGLGKVTKDQHIKCYYCSTALKSANQQPAIDNHHCDGKNHFVDLRTYNNLRIKSNAPSFVESSSILFNPYTWNIWTDWYVRYLFITKIIKYNRIRSGRRKQNMPSSTQEEKEVGSHESTCAECMNMNIPSTICP